MTQNTIGAILTLINYVTSDQLRYSRSEIQTLVFAIDKADIGVVLKQIKF